MNINILPPPNNGGLKSCLHEFCYRLKKLSGASFNLLLRPIKERWPFFIMFWLLIDVCAIRGVLAMKWGEFLPSASMALLFSYVAVWMVWVVGKRAFEIVLLASASVLYLYTLVAWFVFGLRIMPETLTLLMETNSGEASEFVRVFCLEPGVIAAVGSLAVLWVIYVCAVRWRCGICRLLHRMWTIPVPVKGVIAIILSAGLVYGCVNIVRFSKIFYVDTMKEGEDWIFGYYENVGNVYSDAVTAMAFSLRWLNLCGHEMGNWERMNAGLLDEDGLAVCEADSVDVVFVIGESFIKWHSSLYGYGLPTSPVLEEELRRGQLAVFDDYISSCTRTSEAVKNLLTVKDSATSSKNWLSGAYVPVLFRNAGFNVYLWENQQALGGGAWVFNSGLNRFIYNKPAVERCYSATNAGWFRFDGELVDDFSREVAVDASSRNFVLFHLMGQHHDAGSRRPDGWAKWDADDIVRSEDWMTETMRLSIAEYDNATRYNDHVLGKIIDLFRHRDAVVVYVSDHGEEMYDYRPSFGRKACEPCDEGKRLLFQNAVPMVVWWSEGYEKSHPDEVAWLKASVARPGMSDDIGQLLLSVGMVQCRFYAPVKDILSSDYECPSRRVSTGEDFDSITAGMGRCVVYGMPMTM